MCVDRDSTANRCLTVRYCVVVALSTLKWEIVELLCDVCWQRFYGKSLPFGNDSFKHPYVDLLSAEQALADYAVLVTALKTQLNASDSRVIAFGGRYVTFSYLLTCTYLLTYVVSRCSLLSCLASVMSATRPCFRFISCSCLRVLFLTKSKFRFVCVHITMLLNNNLMQKFVDNSRGCCYTVTEECWVLTWGFVIPTSSQAASQQAPQSFLLPATLRGTRSSKMSLRSVHVCCQSQGFLGHFYIRPHELDEVHGGASVNISRKSLLLPQFSTDFGSVYFVW